MEIIDTQFHEIGPHWDWTDEPQELQHRALGEVMIGYLDALGVAKVVLFPGGDDAAAVALTREAPSRFAYVPHLSPDNPDIDGAVGAAKARHGKGLVGLRLLLGWPLDGREIARLDAGAWDPVFAAAERHGVPVFLFVTRWLDRTGIIAAKFPKLSIIVDHLGLPQPPLDARDEPPFVDLPKLMALAAHQNVHVKLCGIPALSNEAYPFADTKLSLRAIVDAFGADRLMWASDISRFSGSIGIHRYQNPHTVGPYLGKHTYAEALFFIRDSDVLTEREKEAILGGTARRVLQL